MTDRRSDASDGTRGVSEIIGFILVFSVVTATVFIAYTSGISGLQDARDFERVENAERAFDVLGDNLADIHAGGAPSRATEIKLAGSELSIGANQRFSVRYENGTGTPEFYNATSLRPIIYAVGDEEAVVYEAGAIIRVSRDGQRMVDEPAMAFRSENGRRTVSIPFVRTIAESQTVVSGSQTTLVRAEKLVPRPEGRYSPVLASLSGAGAPHEIRFRVNTTAARAPAWNQYLEQEISWRADACSLAGADDNVVVCEFETDELYVTRTSIDITFQ